MPNLLEYGVSLKDSFTAVAGKVSDAALGIGVGIAALQGTASAAFSVATGDLTRFGDMFAAIPGPVGQVAQAVGNAFGVMLQKTFEASEGFRKLSEKTGASIEFLSGFTEAADDVFVSSDSVSAALGIFAKKLGGVEDAANDGIGPAKGLGAKFDELGIAMKGADGKARPFEEILLEVSDTFAAMPDGPAKSALAVQLFGKQGMELLPILNKGKEGINEMRKSAEDMGLVFTTKTSEAVTKLKQSQDQLNDTFEGMGRRITQTVVPAFADLITAGQQAQRENNNQAGPLVGLRQAWLLLHPELITAAEDTKKVAEKTNDAAAALRAAEEATKRQTETLNTFTAAIGRNYSEMSTSERITTEWKLATGQITEAQLVEQQAIEAITAAQADGTLSDKDALEALIALKGGTLSAADAFGKAGDKGAKLRSETERVIAVSRAAAGTANEMAGALYAIPNRSVTLTLEGSTEQSYRDTTQDFSDRHNKAVTLTAYGAKNDSYDNVISDYAGVPNRGVTLSTYGYSGDNSYQQAIGNYYSHLNRGVTLYTYGSTTGSAYATYDAYNALHDRTVTVTVQWGVEEDQGGNRAQSKSPLSASASAQQSAGDSFIVNGSPIAINSGGIEFAKEINRAQKDAAQRARARANMRG